MIFQIFTRKPLICVYFESWCIRILFLLYSHRIFYLVQSQKTESCFLIGISQNSTLHFFFEMCAFQFQFSSVAQSRLTLCDPVVSRDCSLVAWTSLWGASRCEGFCSCGSVVGVHWFCCSAACGFFLHQRLSCWLLHWQVDSLPLRCQRSPRGIILTRVGCSVQSLSHVWLFATPWTVARQVSLSITNTWSLLRLMSIV